MHIHLTTSVQWQKDKEIENWNLFLCMRFDIKLQNKSKLSTDF